MSAFYIPESVMAISAHPDDNEFSCAGTIARWTKAGARASYVLCTSGDVGIAEAGMTRQKAQEIRERESKAAAKIVGVDDVVFLREPDGMLEATMDLRKRLVREIRRFRPEVIIANDPSVIFASSNYVNHPDHRAAGLAALEATFPASGQPLIFPEIYEEEGLLPHKPRKIYVVGWQQTDLFVNIEETIDLKVKALQAHESQMKNFDADKYIRERSSEAAKGKEMLYAEPFRVIEMLNEKTWLETSNPKYWETHM